MKHLLATFLVNATSISLRFSCRKIGLSDSCSYYLSNSNVRKPRENQHQLDY